MGACEFKSMNVLSLSAPMCQRPFTFTAHTDSLNPSNTWSSVSQCWHWVLNLFCWYTGNVKGDPVCLYCRRDRGSPSTIKGVLVGLYCPIPVTHWSLRPEALDSLQDLALGVHDGVLKVPQVEHQDHIPWGCLAVRHCSCNLCRLHFGAPPTWSSPSYATMSKAVQQTWTRPLCHIMPLHFTHGCLCKMSLSQERLAYL